MLYTTYTGQILLYDLTDAKASLAKRDTSSRWLYFTRTNVYLRTIAKRDTSSKWLYSYTRTCVLYIVHKYKS